MTKICRYIRTNGRRCGALALSDRAFCFHHNRVNEHRRVLNPPLPENLPQTVIHSMQIDPGWAQREPLTAEYYNIKPKGLLQLDFPPLEDRESIQLALSMLLSAMAHNRIDARTAGPILYGLQVASSNAKDLNMDAKAPSIRDIVVDETGLSIAPDEDPEEEDPTTPNALTYATTLVKLGSARERIVELEAKLALYESHSLKPSAKDPATS